MTERQDELLDQALFVVRVLSASEPRSYRSQQGKAVQQARDEIARLVTEGRHNGLGYAEAHERAKTAWVISYLDKRWP